MAVSLKDISEKTNVSVCTVSQVLNNHPKAEKLRPETREKILTAAKLLGYCRNEAAAAIRKKSSNVLAFVSSEMGSIEYTGRIQNGVLDAASTLGYTILVHHLAKESAGAIAEKLLGWRVAGVIFHVAQLEKIREITTLLDKESIPWGTVNLSNPGGIGCTTNDAAGIEEAVRFLVEKGHERIGYFANSRHLNCEYQFTRYTGYQNGLQKYLPDFSGRFYFLNSPADLQENMYADKLIKEIRKDHVDAVICESDRLAVYLLRGARRNSLSVPEALSLIGFGNGFISENADPPLTTLHQDFEALGEATVQALVKKITSRKNAGMEKKLFPVRLIERFSTANKNKIP